MPNAAIVMPADNVITGTTVNVDPPTTRRDIEFMSVNNLMITSGTSGSNSVLVSQQQWAEWNRHYPIVTYSLHGSTSNAATWYFQTSPTAMVSAYHRSLTTDSVIFVPNTETFTIQGEVRIVPTVSFDWVPGRVIAPNDVHSIPAHLFQPGIQQHRLTREQRERLDRENEAYLRADQLLRMYLDRDQRREWIKDKRFHVQVGTRRYRIKAGRMGNVEMINREGEVLERYCCHPVEMVPTGDCVLSQMLMLKYQEDDFLRIANVQYTAPGFEGQKKRVMGQKPVSMFDAFRVEEDRVAA